MVTRRYRKNGLRRCCGLETSSTHRAPEPPPRAYPPPGPAEAGLGGWCGGSGAEAKRRQQFDAAQGRKTAAQSTMTASGMTDLRIRAVGFRRDFPAAGLDLVDYPPG